MEPWSGVFVDGVGLLAMWRDVPGRLREHAIVTTRGIPRVVFRAQRSSAYEQCRIQAFDISRDRFAFVVRWRDSSWAFGGRTADAVNSVHLVATLAEGTPGFHNVFESVHVGERGLGLESSYRQVFDAPWEGGLASIGTTGNQFWEVWPAVEGVYEDAILFHRNDLRGVREVRVSQAGTMSIPLLAPADGDAFHFATDGTEMAWLEGYPHGGVYERAALLVAPFATRPADVHSRVLLSLPPPPDEPIMLRLGDGIAAAASSGGIELYRLSDGARSVIPPDEGRGWKGGVLFISPTEVALADGPARYSRADGVFILDRAALTFESP